jgi:hypothetical protein
MVRNEADVIETFVRYHCAIVDRMIVVDHLSADATPEILAALADEGLPLEIVRESRPDMAQSEVTSRWMRHAARERGADRVLPLDADEFLALEGGGDVRDALAALPGNGAHRVPWRTYVPRPEDPSDAPHLLARVQYRRRTEPKRYFKVIAPAGLASRDDVVLKIGNHRLLELSGRSTRKIDDTETEGLFLGHFPVRSAAQLATKALLWPAWLANPDRPDKAVPHYRELFDRFKRGDPSARELMEMALNYPIHDFEEGEWPELEHAPIALPGGGLELRHASGAPASPVAVLADCAERLAAELAEVKRAARRPPMRSWLTRMRPTRWTPPSH